MAFLQKHGGKTVIERANSKKKENRVGAIALYHNLSRDLEAYQNRFDEETAAYAKATLETLSKITLSESNDMNPREMDDPYISFEASKEELEAARRKERALCEEAIASQKKSKELERRRIHQLDKKAERAAIYVHISETHPDDFNNAAIYILLPLAS